MANSINGRSEDQILDAGMAMGTHNDEVGGEDASRLNDGLARAFAMYHLNLDFNALLFESSGDEREVEVAFFDFSGFAEFSVDLAGDAFFNVEEEELSLVLSRERTGVS